MRKTVLTMFIMFWAIMPLTATAQGPMGMYDDDSVPGMMMNQGWGMEGSLGALELSAEQETKVRKIFDDLRREHWPILGKILDERERLRDLYNEDTLDAKKIGAVFDVMQGLRKQMVVSKIEALNKVRALLTKEQMEKLKKSGRGRGMAGCGMMGGMGNRGGGHMMREMMLDQ